MKTNLITKEDKAVLRSARGVLKKIGNRLRELEDVRRKCDAVSPVERTAENGKTWMTASSKLYGLLDEIEKAGLCVPDAGNYSVLLGEDRPVYTK